VLGLVAGFLAKSGVSIEAIVDETESVVKAG
jgi:hypothetical protein